MKLSGKKHKKSPVAVICSVLSTVLLILMVVVCLPLTVPRFFGYHIYTVISGSMEPAIPTGSLVYIAEAAPEDMKEKDIIAFYGARDSASIITHRVVENNKLMGQFITKGDANMTEDMNPIPYENFIGKVVLSIPSVGMIAQMFTSFQGKIMAGAVIVAAVLLQAVASVVEHAEKKNSIR